MLVTQNLRNIIPCISKFPLKLLGVAYLSGADVGGGNISICML
jgi:hypothetical protein